MSFTAGWTVSVGADITASMADPPGGLQPGISLGARVEIPVTRAVVSYYRLATLSAGIWTVTLEGVLTAGFYNFVWRTNEAEGRAHPLAPSGLLIDSPVPINVSSTGAGVGAGGGSGGQPDYPTVDLGEVTPTVDDVAQLERTRTVDEYGNEYITFTDATRPTADEVLRVISDATPLVLGSLPTQFDPVHWPKARHCVAMYCAMEIEGSWFKEEALASGRATMPWETEYETGRNELEATINEDRQQNNLLGMMEPRQAIYAEPYYTGSLA